MTNHLNHAHCVLHECYHRQVIAHFPNQIFLLEMAHVANDDVKYSWILNMQNKYIVK